MATEAGPVKGNLRSKAGAKESASRHRRGRLQGCASKGCAERVVGAGRGGGGNESGSRNTSQHLPIGENDGKLKPFNNLGLALMLLGRYADAEAAARHALELDAQSVPAHYTLGRVLSARGIYTPETVELLREATGAFPNARLVLAEVLVNQGAKDQAVAELREYLKWPQADKKKEVECWLANLTHASSRACGQ